MNGRFKFRERYCAIGDVGRSGLDIPDKPCRYIIAQDVTTKKMTGGAWYKEPTYLIVPTGLIRKGGGKRGRISENRQKYEEIIAKELATPKATPHSGKGLALSGQGLSLSGQGDPAKRLKSKLEYYIRSRTNHGAKARKDKLFDFG